MARPKRMKVQGSERAEMPAARVVGPVGDDELVDVTIRVRSASGGLAPRAATAAPMTREELAQQVGASPDDLRVVEDFAHAHGLTVLDTSPAERAVRLRGPAGAMQAAFGVLLNRVEHPGGTFRQRTGTVQVPAALAEIVTGVFGLDDRPQARPHFRVAPVGPSAGGVAAPKAAPHAAGGSFTPPQLAQIYDFPKGFNGQGQTIGIIELGGGYRKADLDAYAAGLGLQPFQVVAVSVDGGHNAPTGDPNGPDGEVVLDIEVAAAVAPRALIAVYFAPNTDRGFLDALSTAVHDSHRKPGVISISWGGPENTWTQQARTAFDQVLQEANAIGVPVFAASGDDGASDGQPGLHVDFPASSPNAIGCGGTRLTAAKTARTAETVWNDLPQGGATGGGFSVFFPAPAFQKPAIGAKKMRGVPDVAADADPVTGYQVRVDGVNLVIGGTSAVAPLLAGLTALASQKAGHGPGVLLPKLYAAGSPSAAFFDVVQGNNGGFNAAKGWDACTGLGVPDGSKFAAVGWAPPKVPALALKGGDEVAPQPA
jgi:kumamolisin